MFLIVMRISRIFLFFKCPHGTLSDFTWMFQLVIVRLLNFIVPLMSSICSDACICREEIDKAADKEKRRESACPKEFNILVCLVNN